jgi:hypothetical protein
MPAIILREMTQRVQKPERGYSQLLASFALIRVCNWHRPRSAGAIQHTKSIPSGDTGWDRQFRDLIHFSCLSRGGFVNKYRKLVMTDNGAWEGTFIEGEPACAVLKMSRQGVFCKMVESLLVRLCGCYL